MPSILRTPILMPSLSACACGRLRRATRALTQLYDDLMAPSGLRVTQYSLLVRLARDGTARMSDLADALLLDRTALSRTLDPLVERGLVSIVSETMPHARSVADPRRLKALPCRQPHWKRAQLQVANKPDRTA